MTISFGIALLPRRRASLITPAPLSRCRIRSRRALWLPSLPRTSRDSLPRKQIETCFSRPPSWTASSRASMIHTVAHLLDIIITSHSYSSSPNQGICEGLLGWHPRRLEYGWYGCTIEQGCAEHELDGPSKLEEIPKGCGCRYGPLSASCADFLLLPQLSPAIPIPRIHTQPRDSRKLIWNVPENTSLAPSSLRQRRPAHGLTIPSAMQKMSRLRPGSLLSLPKRMVVLFALSWMYRLRLKPTMMTSFRAQRALDLHFALADPDPGNRWHLSVRSLVIP